MRSRGSLGFSRAPCEGCIDDGMRSSTSGLMYWFGLLVSITCHWVLVLLWRHVNKESDLNPVPQPHAQQMRAQLPFEIVDHIIGYLHFEDIRSIASFCSTFHLSAQLRLYTTIRISLTTHRP